MGAEIALAARLLELAYSDGSLSEESATALQKVPAVASEVGAALGADPTEDEVLLVTILVDDSSSIGHIVGGIRAVEEGHDRWLEVLRTEGMTQALVHTRFLNGGTFFPYKALDEATMLSKRRLSTEGATPLYHQSVVTLGSVFAKVRQQEEARRRVRAFTVIITDGGDTGAYNLTADHVRVLVTDMLEFASNYIVVGMGIGQRETFEAVFRAMGIPDRWILNAESTAEDMAATFRTIAKSLALAATSEASFLQLWEGSPGG